VIVEHQFFRNKNMHKILFWLFFAKIKMASCVPEMTKSGFTKNKRLFEISKKGLLPKSINESSGLSKVFGKNTFWAHNDGGGKTELYEIDSSGKQLSVLVLKNTKNIDWEDLTVDSKGNIYIGDFGNNLNNRKDLTIYKLSEKEPEKMEKIQFSFADQLVFPPEKKQMDFDCEAMFWANDSLYLFSKNRGTKSTKMYVVPSISGQYNLKPKANIFLKANITGADINPNGKQFALLSYGKVFLFGIENHQIDFSKPQFCIKAPLKQSEALCYISENEVLIINEQRDVFKLKMKISEF
jgi:hypothetical protein